MSVQESASRWRRAKEIFSDALDASGDARAELIQQACGTDADLRRAVEELLALHGESGLALDAPPPFAVAGLLENGGWRPPQREGLLIAGRYRVGRRLGGGGMGEVHEGIDTATGEAVAIKMIRPFAAGSAQAAARFLREARMAGSIDHPNVCRVFGIEEHEGEQFCIMELLEGESLSARLQTRGAMTPAEALPVALDICAGLGAAHRAGVLHRDLKPANIVLARGRAVIIDFGLAAALSSEASLTPAGEVIGTLAYMAPEQLAEGAASPASDLYSLGVVLHEMLTGRKPHAAESPLRLAAQKARGADRALDIPAAAGVPSVWREAIQRCLRGDPRARYAEAGAVAAALARRRPSAGFVLRQPRVLAAALLLALVGGGWGAWRFLQRDYSPLAAARAPYEQAQAALAEAAPLRAVRLLEQSVAADRAFIGARCLLAAAHVDLDQPEKARDAVLEATAEADQRWALGAGERQQLRAARATVTRNFSDAAKEYRALAEVSTGPRKTFALASAAKALDQAGDRQQALATLRGALALDPGNASTQVRYGLLLARAGQREAASDQFRGAAAVFEKSGNLEGLADLLLARPSSRLGGYEADRADLERVLALSEQTGNRYHNLTAKFRMAVVAEQQRDYDGAVRIAREAAEQARREGMPIVAAQALGELGYAFVYLKQPERAAPILEEAVEMAERAKATGVLASNRMRLGEVLGMLRRPTEAVGIMEPAVRWLRESGNRETLPLMLIKWGTLLSGTTRAGEAGAVFAEALELATRDGNELYQSMAVQRMGGWNADRDPVKAAEFFERTVEMGRKTKLTGSLFQAASAWTSLGRFGRAEQLIAEGDVAKLQYPPGVDRSNLESHVLSGRAYVAHARGQCETAELLMHEAVRWTPLLRERHIHLLRTCATDPAKLRQSLAWLQADSSRVPPTDHYTRARNGAAMAAIELGLGNWRGAKDRAAVALKASNTLGLRVFALESLLALRAAERKLSNVTEADRAGSEALEIARSFGFSPPEAFGGRQDLVRLWNLGRH